MHRLPDMLQFIKHYFVVFLADYQLEKYIDFHCIVTIFINLRAVTGQALQRTLPFASHVDL